MSWRAPGAISNAARTAADVNRKGCGLVWARAITLCFLLVSDLGLATAQVRVTKKHIVDMAKLSSERYCYTGLPGSYKKVGCEYSAQRHQQTWSVIVHSIYLDDKGQRIAVSDADRIYEYDLSGRFIRDLMDR
jgi:hypothetical protein